NARCDDIEECYEFMLAYAGQGLDNEQSGGAGGQIRQFLTKCDGGVAVGAEFIGEFVKRLNIESAAPYTAFMHVIDRDARDAMAAAPLAVAQPALRLQRE